MDHIDITFRQTVIILLGGVSTSLMECSRSETYTRSQWRALTQNERDGALKRYDAFHRIVRRP